MTRRQHGATMIEFALVLLVFLVFLLGLVDFSRMLYWWNAADEATRAGARFAAVCHDSTDASDEAVRTHMRQVLPNIESIYVRWEPAGCDHTTCQGLRVGIGADGSPMEAHWLSPIRGLTSFLTMPSFETYLPREVMRQDPLSESHWCTNPPQP